MTHTRIVAGGKHGLICLSIFGRLGMVAAWQDVSDREIPASGRDPRGGKRSAQALAGNNGRRQRVPRAA